MGILHTDLYHNIPASYIHGLSSTTTTINVTNIYNFIEGGSEVAHYNSIDLFTLKCHSHNDAGNTCSPLYQSLVVSPTFSLTLLMAYPLPHPWEKKNYSHAGSDVKFTKNQQLLRIPMSGVGTRWRLQCSVQRSSNSFIYRGDKRGASGACRVTVAHSQANNRPRVCKGCPPPVPPGPFMLAGKSCPLAREGRKEGAQCCVHQMGGEMCVVLDTAMCCGLPIGAGQGNCGHLPQDIQYGGTKKKAKQKTKQNNNTFTSSRNYFNIENNYRCPCCFSINKKSNRHFGQGLCFF